MGEYADGLSIGFALVGVLFGMAWFLRVVQMVLRWFGLGT